MISDFTAIQNQTYESIEKLENELEEILTPEIFVLNSRIQQIQRKIISLQNDCDHIWEGNSCQVCGKVNEE